MKKLTEFTINRDIFDADGIEQLVKWTKISINPNWQRLMDKFIGTETKNGTEIVFQKTFLPC